MRPSVPLAVCPLEDRTTPAAVGYDPGRVATADVDGDGLPDTLTVSGAGVAATLTVQFSNRPAAGGPTPLFEPGYTGGVRVAAGDLDGDGRAEVVATAAGGGSGRVVVLKYGPNGFTTVASFYGIADANFRGGASVAVADVDGDGKADVVVGAGYGGGPRVAVFGGPGAAANAPTRVTNDFFGLADAAFRGGVAVAAGDLDGDGLAEVIVGAGPGGAARTRVLSGKAIAGGQAAAAAPMADFLLGGYDDGGRQGESVAYRPKTATRAAGFIVYPTRSDASPGGVRDNSAVPFSGAGLPLPSGIVPATDGVIVG